MLAAARGELSAVEVLSPFSKLDAVDEAGSSKTFGDPNPNPNPNPNFEAGRTALEIAAIEGHLES